jgi:amidase
MPANDSAYLTATQFKELLTSRRVSALELLELHLARVKKLNPAYNAVVALDEEERANRRAKRTMPSRAASISARCMAYR